MAVEIVTKAEIEALLKSLFDELKLLKDGQVEILARLDKARGPGITPEYIPALDYMKAVGIKRWKFNELIAGNLIKTIKKKRKIYVAVREVNRYFMDPGIQ